MHGECLWFSQGCTIGCSCTGDPENPVPEGAQPIQPTITDNQLLTYPGYQKGFPSTPWRAPGHSGVLDSCGVSGGGPIYHPENGGTPAPGYKQGFKGSDLPATKSTTWKAGGVAEVSWGIRANHGGGYLYRLCPKGKNLTEACFDEMPLMPIGDTSWIQYGTNETNRTAINAVRVSEGTHPAGSTWTKNPVPGCTWYYNNSDPSLYISGGLGIGGKGKDGTYSCPGPLYKPPLEGLYGFGSSVCGHVFDFECTPEQKKYQVDHFLFNIIDQVRVPDVKGEYVLSWRWDCEQTPQVWTSCADISVV
jgi:hypothetical protein